MMDPRKIANWVPAEHNTDVSFSVGVKLPVRAMGINFMPSWWHAKHGIDFGEKYIFDPDYRVETVRYKWAAINKLYPELNVGDPDPKPQVIPVDFHNSLGPAAMGCEVIYPVDNYPISKPAKKGAAERLRAPADIEDTFPYNEMIRQVKYLNGKLGQDKKPFIFKNGILNDAILIFGDGLFLDLYDDNEAASRAMGLSLELGYRVFGYNFRQKSMPGIMPLCNCTAQLIGPGLYESAQLGYDQKIAEYLICNGAGIMIHHCGDFDGFIDLYKKLPKPAAVQIGHKSNARMALDAFPDAQVDYCYSTPWLIAAAAGDVRDHTRMLMEGTRGDWHRLSISIGDLDVTIPESYVMEIYETIMHVV